MFLLRNKRTGLKDSITITYSFSKKQEFCNNPAEACAKPGILAYNQTK